MHRSTTRRQALLATMATLASTTAISACTSGSPDDSDGDPANSPKQNKHSDPDRHASDASFPVGEPFGEAAWSVDEVVNVEGVTVRGNRLIVHRGGFPPSISVYANDGSEVWFFELPDSSDQISYDVQILEETVAFLTRGEIDSQSLAESSSGANVLLLSLEDGSVVAEAGLPIESDRAFPPERLIGDGAYMTESGELFDFPIDDIEPKLVDGTLIWSEEGADKAEEFLATENWRSSEYSFGWRKKIVNWRRGLMLVQGHDTGDPSLIGHVIDVHTGEVPFSISSENNPSAESRVGRYLSPLRNDEPSICSPNGAYVVDGALWMSESQGRCIGGGEGQQNVTLTAVDDAGTAYGVSEEGKLVVVPVGSEAYVSELPEIRPYRDPVPPFAIMEGGLALHWDGLIVTANPIK